MSIIGDEEGEQRKFIIFKKCFITEDRKIRKMSSTFLYREIQFIFKFWQSLFFRGIRTDNFRNSYFYFLFKLEKLM